MNNKIIYSAVTFLTILAGLWLVFNKIYPKLPSTPSYSESERPIVKPDALTMPLAGVFKVIDDKVVKVGELRDGYFPCIILKTIKIGDESYVLIRIEQYGLASDILMVKEKSVVVLDQKVATNFVEVK